MFKNKEIFSYFFEIVSDQRNLSYKKYDEEYGVIHQMNIPYHKEKELFLDGVTKEDFDFLYELGSAICSGDIERVKNVLNKKDGEQVAISFVTRCFTLAKYMGRSNAEVASKTLIDFVNGGNVEEMVPIIANCHPTLQQSIMGLFVEFCKQMADKKHTDARNENSVAFAKNVKALIEADNDFCLPLI